VGYEEKIKTSFIPESYTPECVYAAGYTAV
jgi:hypothetical protein